ncbi:MAG: preprotein translocase subunit YajC [Bacteroidetes bacterium]|nr:preprotein translocase subunit YajC [Bacteroidota bacterium]
MIDLNTILLMGQPAGGKSGGGMGQLIMIPLILVVFYFFMLRPQQKKAKEQKEFKEGVGKGDKVVTIGGVHGKIIEVRDTTFILEVGNALKLEVEKSAISVEMTKALTAEVKA